MSNLSKRKVFGGVLLALLAIAALVLGLAKERPPAPRPPVAPPHIARICIIKFEDHNADGMRTPGEPLLPGWEYDVTGVGRVVTGADGRVCFNVRVPGLYTITEIVKPGWSVTSPNPQTVHAVSEGATYEVWFGNRKGVGHCDLAIRKSATEFRLVMAAIIYEITVTNVGTAVCPGPTTVVEVIPAGTEFVSAFGAGWTFERLPNVVICTYAGDIAPGQSVSFQITFRLPDPGLTPAPVPPPVNCAVVLNCRDCNVLNNIVKTEPWGPFRFP